MTFSVWFQTKTPLCFMHYKPVSKAVLEFDTIKSHRVSHEMLITLWFVFRFWFCPVHVAMGWAECPERFSTLHGTWDGVPAPVWFQGGSLVSRSHSLWWVLCVHLFISSMWEYLQHELHTASEDLLKIMPCHFKFSWQKCNSMH